MPHLILPSVLACPHTNPRESFDRHYVAFIRKEIPEEGNQRSWVLFNDEKVVKAADIDEMKKFAYVYFFRRV